MLFCSIKNLHTVVKPSPPSISEVFPSPKLKLYPLPPIKQVPIPPPPQSLTTTVLSVSMNSIALCTIPKWNHTVLVLLWSGCFTSHNVFQVHPHCCMCQNFHPFKGQIVVQSPSCVWLCDPMDCSTPGFPVLHYLLEFASLLIHVRWISDAI